MGKPQSKGKKKVIAIKSRKQLRKDKRNQVKINRREHFSKNKKNQNGKNNEEKEQEIDDDIEITSESDILSENEAKTEKKEVKEKKVQQSCLERIFEEKKDNKKKEKKLNSKMRKRRIEQLKAANDEDDKIIRSLEKKLKIDKNKAKTVVPSIFNDGLDYALELCLPSFKEKHEYDEEEDFKKSRKQREQSDTESEDQSESENEMDSENDMENQSEFGTDIEDDSDLSENENPANKKRKVVENKNKKMKKCEEEDDEEEEQKNKKSKNKKKMKKEVEEAEDEENNKNHKGNSELNFDDIECEETTKMDIYGRKIDVKGNIVSENAGKYIPPHLKNNLNTENQNDERVLKLNKLRRILKGHLNRMSEANMGKISKEIEQLYMKNSRFDMNNTLTTLILEATVKNVITTDRMILEHVLLITVLHANIGSEIGALFLQTIVDKFHNLATKINEINVEDKTLDNLVLILCYLYIFKIIQEQLLFQIIEVLSTRLQEKTLECLLIVLRSVGFSLRKDNPTSFKELIINLQKKATEESSIKNDNFRLKYMLDILLAIKNNNVNKIPQYDTNLSEHLRKLSKSFVYNGKFVTTLNISLDDLLKANQNGKWWIVGSAWTGNITQNDNSKTGSKTENGNVDEFSDKLLKLGKKQRMNTENKKNVFCILMSAEDYIDAFEKLVNLEIKENNVITSVILHCCLAEKKYNPYYSILIQKFCELDRTYQLSMQFICWDKIRDLETLPSIKIHNFAQMIIHLLKHGGITLSILKIIDFSDLNKSTLRFIKDIMLGILLSDEEIFHKVFAKISLNTKLNIFKDSLCLFMHHFLIKKNSEDKSNNMDLLIKRVKYVNELFMSSKSNKF